MKQRILYFGMISTEGYLKASGAGAFIGAGAGKMSSVIHALRLANRKAVLVSLPFITDGATLQPGRICHIDGFPAYFLPTTRLKVGRRFFAIFAFAWFAARRVNCQDIVLFYNHAFEYVLALLILRLRGVNVFQDIEDIPTKDERGLRGVASHLGYRIMFALSSPRKVTVSNQVGHRLGLTDYIAIPGISALKYKICFEKRWASFAEDAKLRVHFGGTLNEETGLGLFLATLDQLDARANDLTHDITFVITGVGNFDALKNKYLNLTSSRLKLELYPGIDRSEYFRILESCHVSLSLRDPSAELSFATFPSKVVEITTYGLALVASRVSDIENIFNDNDAWLLAEFDVYELTQTLLEISAHPHEVRRRAELGKARARERFDPTSVGLSLAAFLEAEPSTLQHH